MARRRAHMFCSHSWTLSELITTHASRAGTSLRTLKCSLSTNSCRPQVEMTVVSALFMIPTGVVFPVLLRAANTPPASVTLQRTERQDQHEDPGNDLFYQLQLEQEQRDADFRNALQSGEFLQPQRLSVRGTRKSTTGVRRKLSCTTGSHGAIVPLTVNDERRRCHDVSTGRNLYSCPYCDTRCCGSA